ncbi:hypothetical protein Acr_00g0042680 [Actinidia rufa]|uniref:Uncharacterized protein n=1 Tax=Actinidia rufa TaxID=165716 RepID=A0A7J0DIT2_9ERIC|nr:hypothetical protein Acr_00g0042680 [Actinidia rufa]
MPNHPVVPDPPLAPQPILAITVPGEVMMVDSAKDHDTSLALAQAVMLPNIVADLAMEGSEEICDLLIMQQEIGIPVDPPAWNKATPEVEQLDPPLPYSPLMLPGFNEEEYLKELAYEDLEKCAEVGGNLSLDTAETSTTVNGSLDVDASLIV